MQARRICASFGAFVKSANECAVFEQFGKERKERSKESKEIYISPKIKKERVRKSAFFRKFSRRADLHPSPMVRGFGDRGRLCLRWRCWQGVPVLASCGAFSRAVCGLAFALPLRFCRYGRKFCPFGAFSPSVVVYSSAWAFA